MKTALTQPNATPTVAASIDASTLRRGVLYMAVAALFWAIVEILGGFTTRGQSPFETVWVRYGVHLLFMLVLVAPRRRRGMIATKHIGRQILRSMTMLGMPIFFVGGIIFMPIDQVWAINWLSTLVVLVLAIPFLGERVTPGLWLTGAIGYAGVILILQPHFPALNWHLIMPAGMCLCFSIYKIMTRWMRDEDHHANLFHTAFWVFLVLACVAPLFWEWPTKRGWAALIGIGVIGYYALSFIDLALENAPAVLTAPMLYTQSIWVALLHALLRGTQPRHRALAAVGALAIIACAAYVLLIEVNGQGTAPAMLGETEAAS